MGQTLADIHAKFYYKARAKVKSHEEAMEFFPEEIRPIVEAALKRTPFERHYGVSKSAFVIMNIIFVIVAIIFVIIVH